MSITSTFFYAPILTDTKEVKKIKMTFVTLSEDKDVVVGIGNPVYSSIYRDLKDATISKCIDHQPNVH